MPIQNPNEPPKRDRVIGGAVPTNKPVVVDYDSEDEIIVTMKQQGRSDMEVVERLCEEGRTKYNSKSINSRYMRILTCLRDADEQKLDEQCQDWRLEDDERLDQAYKKSELRLNHHIGLLKEKQAYAVAEEINTLLPSPRFSARACKERYEAIQAGTARVPVDLDPDPEGRECERQARIQALQASKNNTPSEDQRRQERTMEKKRQKASKKQAAREKVEATAAAREEAMKEEQNFVQTKADARTERRMKRKTALRHRRAIRAYMQKKHRVETKLLHKLEKADTARARHLARFSRQFPLPEEALQFKASLSSKASGKKAVFATEPPGQAFPKMDFTTEEQMMDQGSQFDALTLAHGKDPAAPNAAKGKSTMKHNRNAPEYREVFGETPRSMLCMAELYDIMRARGMLLGRMKEVKSVVLSRIDAEDESLDRAGLRRLLSERGDEIPAPVVERMPKAVLIRRLQEADAKTSALYRRRYADKPSISELAQRNGVILTAPAEVNAIGATRSPTTGRHLPSTGSRFTAIPTNDKTKSAKVGVTKRYNARARTLALENELTPIDTTKTSQNRRGNPGSGISKTSRSKTPSTATIRASSNKTNPPPPHGYDGTFSEVQHHLSSYNAAHNEVAALDYDVNGYEYANNIRDAEPLAPYQTSQMSLLTDEEREAMDREIYKLLDQY